MAILCCRSCYGGVAAWQKSLKWDIGGKRVDEQFLYNLRFEDIVLFLKTATEAMMKELNKAEKGL